MATPLEVISNKHTFNRMSAPIANETVQWLNNISERCAVCARLAYSHDPGRVCSHKRFEGIASVHAPLIWLYAGVNMANVLDLNGAHFHHADMYMLTFDESTAPGVLRVRTTQERGRGSTHRHRCRARTCARWIEYVVVLLLQYNTPTR